MNTKVFELIDFEKVDNLLEGFNKTTGFVTAILDLEGNILSKSGWRQMCTAFHRVNPETSKRCTISDTILAGKMAKGEKYHFYKCLNGLVDVAVPIVIKGEHIANLFSGQFFLEEPDIEFFRKQAKVFGFDEENYIEALKKVPITSMEEVKIAMNFLLSMTEMISEVTYQKMEQIEMNEAIITSNAVIKKLNEDLEKRVQERTVQLENANKELETFTYSVSHDLKAPLRGIDGYSKLLLDLHASSLDEEGQHFLRSIRESATQMHQLIEDLLDYSRLERSQISHDRIQINTLINSLVESYQNKLENSEFAFKTEVPDVTVEGNKSGLTIALRNIIENAIKFTKGRSDPSVTIGLKDLPSTWVIEIKDNGIGFDMKYHQRIFEIFQRLHRAEEFPGTGIGLAMVSKAMQRMQGNVWAESQPGIGSSFYLEIPKNQSR